MRKGVDARQETYYKKMLNLNTITQTLKDYFKSKSIPNPHNYPKSYLYYLSMYHHFKKEKS